MQKTMQRTGQHLVWSGSFLLFLLFVNVWFPAQLYQQSAAAALAGIDPADASFRRLQMGEALVSSLPHLQTETGMTAGEILTVLAPFAGNTFSGPGRFAPEDLVRWKERLLWYGRRDFLRVRALYAALLDDLQYFPVAASGVRYENSWMFERTYGGRRGHEGCDLTPPENIPDHYAVVSMTDGVVEQLGWLPLGGWRVGIRGQHGAYFYYAHLFSYADGLRKGQTVRAGQLLGRMGDTGYGEEGTRGKFDVHLHLGIYLRDQNGSEQSVNPYWALRFLQSFPAKPTESRTL